MRAEPLEGFYWDVVRAWCFVVLHCCDEAVEFCWGGWRHIHIVVRGDACMAACVVVCGFTPVSLFKILSKGFSLLESVDQFPLEVLKCDPLACVLFFEAFDPLPFLSSRDTL